MTAEFDKYAGNYKEIINEVSRISGEEYEYFIGLRIGLMKAKLAKKPAAPARRLRILDFGCGIGTTEIFLKEAFPDAEIWGIDPSAASIAEAKRLGLEDVGFLVSEPAALPFSDGHFDLIYTNGTFHHIARESHADTLRELSRVLKKEGDLFIFENNPFNPLMMRAMAKNPFDRGVKALHAGYLKKSTIKAGFRLNCVNYYFFFPKCLWILRVTEKYLKRLQLGAQYFIWASRSISKLNPDNKRAGTRTHHPGYSGCP